MENINYNKASELLRKIFIFVNNELQANGGEINRMVEYTSFPINLESYKTDKQFIELIGNLYFLQEGEIENDQFHFKKMKLIGEIGKSEDNFINELNSNLSNICDDDSTTTFSFVVYWHDKNNEEKGNYYKFEYSFSSWDGLEVYRDFCSIVEPKEKTIVVFS